MVEQKTSKDNIEYLLVKYNHFICYVFFGVASMIINIGVFWFLSDILRWPTTPSNIIAWILYALFAFVTNRRWVFKSNAKNKEEITREFIRFVVCRISTGVFDVVFMAIFVDILSLHHMTMKLISCAIVVILNYIASRIIIFKTK